MRDALGPRVASGIALAVVAVGAVYFGGVLFQVVVAVAALLLAWEWDRLVGGSGRGPVLGIHALAAAVVVVAAGAGAMGIAALAVVVGACLAGTAAAWTGRSWAWAVAGNPLIAATAMSAVWLRAEPEYGSLALLWLFAVIWSTDSGAYGFGRIIGGPRLAPRASPGKTWAGLVGGTATASIVGVATAAVLGFGPWWVALSLSATVALAGQGGDLAVSRIKRHFLVKDSGRLIPGHGGVLDRLDSTVATLPLAALGLAVVQATGVRWP